MQYIKCHQNDKAVQALVSGQTVPQGTLWSGSTLFCMGQCPETYSKLYMYIRVLCIIKTVVREMCCGENEAHREETWFLHMRKQGHSTLLHRSHRIGGNRERRVLNNFMFSIAKINVFDCQNRYNGNRKRLIWVHRLLFWQSKTLYLAILNDFSENERSFAIAAFPVCR